MRRALTSLAAGIDAIADPVLDYGVPVCIAFAFLWAALTWPWHPNPYGALPLTPKFSMRAEAMAMRTPVEIAGCR